MTNILPDDPVPNRKPIDNRLLAGHPVFDNPNTPDEDPKLTEVTDTFGWNSGPMVDQPVRPIVAEAIAAMKAWAGDVRRDRALNVLKSWKRFPDLTSPEVLAIIKTFPPPLPRTNRHKI